ncbi:MAG TPA: hypothetical protein VFQ45_07655 [Longimicrobium sp.]|nr:hypothetical protein [Longimicrobium sp.]
MRPIRTPLTLLLAAAGLAACARNAPPAAPGAGPNPAAETPAPQVARFNSADAPDALATAILEGCRGGGRRLCVERSLKQVLAEAGVRKSMETLDIIAERDAQLRNDSHGMAHGLGISAYGGRETVAETFAACPPTQISGCMHGVIQGYFLDVGRGPGQVGKAEIDGLCQPHAGNFILHSQCTHGLGHGLMSLVGHHLPRALEKCDLAGEEWVRRSCYGGAFMENLVGALHPEHTAEAHSEVAAGRGAGGHDHHGGGQAAGHDHGAAPVEAWKPLDDADPLYPCSAVASKYQEECYMIHTGALLSRYRGDFAATARTCATAPAAMVPVCWRSLGRDISAWAGRDPVRAARMCASAGSEAEMECVRGAATALVEVNWKPEDGLGLCRVAPAGPAKTECYRAVGRQMELLLPVARREELCATAEPDQVPECRAAARVERDMR